MKKLSVKPYFVNSIGECYSVIAGRYGNYAQTNFKVKFSEKEMKNMGYKIVMLSDEEVDAYRAKEKEFNDRLKAEELTRKLNQAAECITICLASAPIEIGAGNHLWEHVTNVSDGMKNAYSGCGSGLAYIKDGKIIAFHYGKLIPENAPKCDVIQEVDFSCSQILF